jgi:glycerol-3-phosphate acyltransferase PlsY
MNIFEAIGSMSMNYTFTEVMTYGYFGCNFGLSHNWNTSVVLFACAICAICAYLCGSINCGVLLSRLRYGVDIRTKGSGNAGATNMMRVYGKKAAIFTFLGDMLKTAVAIIIGYLLLGYYIGAYLAGFFCVLGHAYPVFFKFKGGKGVVAIATMGLLTEPIVFLIMLALFVIILYGYKMVSLASIMVVLIYPLMLTMILPLENRTPIGAHMIFALLTSFFIVFLHRKNIVRIFNHTESKFNIGKKKQDNKPKVSLHHEENENEESEK